MRVHFLLHSLPTISKVRFAALLAVPLCCLHLSIAIAKHLRKGRQEDTHEFLRYAIDALQKSCLAGYPPFVSADILGIYI